MNEETKTPEQIELEKAEAELERARVAAREAERKAKAELEKAKQVAKENESCSGKSNHPDATVYTLDELRKADGVMECEWCGVLMSEARR